jgi:thioredoxin-like negative regulator of GroEL
MQVLDTVAVFSGPDLLVCCATEDLLPFLERRFGIAGTPTHILLDRGRVLDSLMGRTSAQTLISFIRPHLQRFLQAPHAPESLLPAEKAREVPRGKRIKAL